MTNGDGRALLAATMPAVADGSWQLLECRPVAVTKQRRKRIVVYAIRYVEDGDRHPTNTHVLAKVYGPEGDHGQLAFNALTRLHHAGLAVPRPFGYSPEHAALVQERVGGRPWADSLNDPSITSASEAAAAWLLDLQRCTVETDWPAPAAPSPTALAIALSHRFPATHTRLTELTAELERRLQSPNGTAVPSHGDLHPKNVLVQDDRVVVIDLDHFGMRSPAFDVGYAIGQLLVMSSFRLGALGPGARAGVAFWTQYATSGTASWAHVAAEVARTFLQSLHYELVILGNGRHDLLGAWPDLMEAFLASRHPDDLARLAR